MNDNDFKKLFKDTEMEAPDNISVSIMQRIDLQSKTNKAHNFANMRIVNSILALIISISIAVYYFFFQDSTSVLSRFSEQFSEKYNQIFKDLFTYNISNSILISCILILFMYFFDRILSNIFNKKKLFK